MRRAIGLLAISGLVVGCTSLATVSSGQVGCPPETITISNDEMSWGGRTWTAECNGQTFHCSAHGGGEGSTSQVSCAPAGGTTIPGGSQAAPPPAAGCQYDTQCKGERVCVEGECVDAATPASAPATPPASAPATPPASAPATPTESAPATPPS